MFAAVLAQVRSITARLDQQDAQLVMVPAVLAAVTSAAPQDSSRRVTVARRWHTCFSTCKIRSLVSNAL
jgi:hypothetical protein